MREKGRNRAGLAVLEQALRLNREALSLINKGSYQEAVKVQDRVERYARVAKRLFGIK